jgi:hypothetical protein
VKNGRLWVLGLLVLGAGAGLFAVWHWSRPENSVRWSFTQLHTSLMRRHMDTVRQIAADRVILDGVDMSREDFIAAYEVPRNPTALLTAPCPAAPDHWVVLMAGRAWCFAPHGRGWKLHRVGGAPCDEK